MSLQLNLANREIKETYNQVLNAQGIDWALFTYEKGSNDLKVQSTGYGGLEELEEEFSDGRYAHDSTDFFQISEVYNGWLNVGFNTRLRGWLIPTFVKSPSHLHWRTNSTIFVYCRASCPSLSRLTGAVMVCPNRRKVYLAATPAPCPTFFVAPML